MVRGKTEAGVDQNTEGDNGSNITLSVLRLGKKESHGFGIKFLWRGLGHGR